MGERERETPGGGKACLVRTGIRPAASDAVLRERKKGAGKADGIRGAESLSAA